MSAESKYHRQPVSQLAVHCIRPGALRKSRGSRPALSKARNRQSMQQVAGMVSRGKSGIEARRLEGMYGVLSIRQGPTVSRSGTDCVSAQLFDDL